MGVSILGEHIRLIRPEKERAHRVDGAWKVRKRSRAKVVKVDLEEFRKSWNGKVPEPGKYWMK